MPAVSYLKRRAIVSSPQTTLPERRALVSVPSTSIFQIRRFCFARLPSAGSLSDPNLQDDIYSAIRAVYVNTLNQQYAHYIAYEEVDKAAAHIPELTKLKDEHTQQFSLRLRKLFEKFGYCNEAKKLEDLSAFLYQVAVMMLRLTALSSGETRELRAELSLRIVDELVKAAVELAQ